MLTALYVLWLLVGIVSTLVVLRAQTVVARVRAALGERDDLARRLREAVQAAELADGRHRLAEAENARLLEKVEGLKILLASNDEWHERELRQALEIAAANARPESVVTGQAADARVACAGQAPVAKPALVKDRYGNVIGLRQGA